MLRHYVAIDSLSERLLHPRLRLFGRNVSAFHICGAVGFTLALILVMVLTSLRGLSEIVMAGITLFALFMFLAQAMAFVITTGRECLIYYRASLLVLAAVALFLFCAGEPVLPYLDITTLGIGLFAASGRMGCLLAGCCHGMPHRLGVRYSPEHVESGFPRYLVGVRLLPVQALEALLIVHIVGAGVVIFVGGSEPGSILSWYIVTYATGRFALEFLRGDTGRTYIAGFSEAQWTSLLLVTGICIAGYAGVLPMEIWQSVALIFIAVWMSIVALGRHREDAHRSMLLQPHHVREMAHALEYLDSGRALPDEIDGLDEGQVRVASTSLGLKMSGGVVGDESWQAYHYAISWRGRKIRRSAAEAVANVIVELQRRGETLDLIEGRSGVFHLLIYPGIESKVDILRRLDTSTAEELAALR